MVLVRKKDGGLWFCIEFHHLNTCSKQESYPLPRIQEALESLVGARHFSYLDLKLGFWQMKMEEALKQYTAFRVGNLGFFKCDCIPFGLCNVPAMFQRLMQKCQGKLNLIYCLIYLDDIIMFSWLCMVLNQFCEYNLRLKPLKFSLFKEEINYLAH